MRFFYVFIIFCSFAFSQKIINVKSAKGTSFISGNISYSQAKLHAISEAKLNALRIANIGEDINSYETLLTSEINGDFQELFSSDFYSQIKGAIKSYEEIEPIKQENVLDGVRLTVTIKAKVIKYNTVTDPGFQVAINGIRGSYNDNENLDFTTRVSRNCYLTIFIIDKNEAGVLFPSEREETFNLLSDQDYQFPIDDSSYQIIMSDKEADTENTRLLFVYTKSLIPYLYLKDNTTDEKEIFSWINSIEPDQRNIKSYSFFVTK